MAPSHLRNIGSFLEALRHDPCLLFRRPLPSPTLPRDHLDATIGATFLPGIKHAFMNGICHKPTSKKQFMPGCIAAHSRDAQVGGPCRLRLAQVQERFEWRSQTWR